MTGKETFTKSEARELFITAWCAARYRGSLSAINDAREITKSAAGEKFDHHIELNYKHE